jgi:hypothetical protein
MAVPSNGHAMDGMAWTCKRSRNAQRSKCGLAAAQGRYLELPLQRLLRGFGFAFIDRISQD